MFKRRKQGTDHETIAQRLAELVETESLRFDTFRPEQQNDCHNDSYLDELAGSGEHVPDWLAGRVEVRAIGHRLNAEGGLPLMQSICRRVGEIRPFYQRSLDSWWDGIGEWMG